jgi:hypothetical protein
MKQRSPNYEEALLAVDNALTSPPGLLLETGARATVSIYCRSTNQNFNIRPAVGGQIYPEQGVSYTALRPDTRLMMNTISAITSSR